MSEYQVLTILAAFAFFYSVVASRLERTPINGALVYLLAGLVIYPLVEMIGDREWQSIAFIVMVVVPMLCFGSFCIYTAYKMWKEVTIENLRRVSFIAGILGFFAWGMLFGERDVEDPWLQLILVLAIIAGGVVYLACLRILRYAEVDPDGVDLGDIGEQAVGRGDVRAVLHLGITGQSGHRGPIRPDG